MADSGGEHDVTLTIETDNGPVSATDTVELDGIDSTISEVDTTFYESFDTCGFELSSVSFSVRNDGDISLQYDSVEIEIAGASRTDDPYGTAEIEPGASTSEYVTISDNIVMDQGSHDLTIRLVLDGDTVASETTTVTTK
ncbi:carbohydrate-binding protein [Halorubrum sp. CSM-61]|uniref:carbohydrate-binding protein n=1 Tax=Halorubrum sp. CSM-61 TaxID=2485838 RepID=UPI001F14C202|nr:carbohydrate-binding protein [Halorubrum sp. CSM-61]